MARLNTWRTAGGEVRVRDLGDRHLLNILAMIERRTREAHEDALSSAVTASCMVFGEAASDMMDRDIEALEATDPDLAVMRDDRYWTLLCLAAKRGLVESGRVDLGRAVRDGYL